MFSDLPKVIRPRRGRTRILVQTDRTSTNAHRPPQEALDKWQFLVLCLWKKSIR